MSRFEKKLKDKLGDEIKLDGLEALVLEELVDRTPTRTTHLCTYSASQTSPHRCFTHATRVAQDCALQCL